MLRSDRAHQGYQYPDGRIRFAQRVGQSEIVTYELIPVIRPVTRICVVETEVDDGNVAGKFQGILEFRLIHIRPVTFSQKRRSWATKITDFVSISQKLLKLRRI